MDKIPKYQSIADELKSAIRVGQIRPGQYLPSQNELVTQYGVSMGTVRQAIGVLTTAGWVQAEKGRGTFVCIPDQRGHTAGKLDGQATIGYAVIGQYNHYGPTNQLLLHSVTPVVQAGGKKLAYGIFPREEDFYQRFSDFLTGLSGVMVYHHITSDVLDIIRDHQIPAVLLGHVLCGDIDTSDFTQVSADLGAAGYMLAQAIAMHGHRKVGLIGSEETHSFKECWNNCKRGCEEHHISFVDLTPAKQTGSSADITMVENIPELVQSIQGEELTCLIVYGDRQACQLIHDLQMHGFRVPADCSVIGMGGNPRESLMRDDLARVNLNFIAIGQQAAQYLVDPPRRIIQRFIPPRLEVGGTLEPLGNERNMLHANMLFSHDH